MKNGHSYIIIKLAMLYYSWWPIAQMVLMRPGLWIQFPEDQLASLYLVATDPGPFTLAKSLINLCSFSHRSRSSLKFGNQRAHITLEDTEAMRSYLIDSLHPYFWRYIKLYTTLNLSSIFISDSLLTIGVIHLLKMHFSS